MLSYNDAFYQLKNKLQSLYDPNEAAAIAHELMEHVTGLGKLERLMQKDAWLNETEQQQYSIAYTSLADGMPLQYVTGHCWFMGKKYRVNEHVLIPRPETEELVQWIIDENNKSSVSVLDIGTGSGCIPISIKLAMPAAKVDSFDISADAITLANENAIALQAEVNFVHQDFLNDKMWGHFGVYDVIVSNPPYIPVSEKNNMHDNVTKHEPHLALFVPDNDPLLFYKAIALFAKTHLKPNGAVYCELSADHAIATGDMFSDMGYEVILKKDLHGNMRMLKAWLNKKSEL